MLIETPSTCGKLAVGWLFTAVVLSNYTDPHTSSVALFSLFLAELLSKLLIAGFQDTHMGSAHSFALEDTIAHILLRWIILSGFLITATYSNALFFFKHDGFAIVCILGLSLVLGMAKITLLFQKRNDLRIEKLMQLRVLLIGFVVTLFAQAGSLNADIVLALAVVFALFLFAATLWKLIVYSTKNSEKVPSSVVFERFVVTAMPILFRHADLLILPWILSPVDTFAYLVARGCAHSIGLILGFLSMKLDVNLRVAFAQAKYDKFVAVAARANLGILLIGGAGFLATLSVGPYLMGSLGVDSTTARTLLLWAMVAESTPMIFGATWLLLGIVENHKEAKLIAAVGIFAIWMSPKFGGISEAVDLAMMFALVHITCAAVTAALLGIRFGIWPGLTAIFFHRIKLL